MTDKYYNELSFKGLRIIIQESDCANGIIVDYYKNEEEHIGTETFWYNDLE
tara:strand:- start:1068 stop:1220 length:153 start_codon:yes stop_codon:yes gene_type:complete